jgi:hypothetical protein
MTDDSAHLRDELRIFKGVAHELGGIVQGVVDALGIRRDAERDVVLAELGRRLLPAEPRALAGEAEPTGDVPPVWWSPSLAAKYGKSGLIDRDASGYRVDWNGPWQAELPADAVRLVPAGGSAPADESDGDHASVPRVHLKWWAETLRALASHAIQAKNAQDTALETAARISFWAQERLADEQAQMTRDALTAPHQGATTDVTALLAELDRIAADPHRAWLYADQIRALLGAGETTEADQ